MREGVLDSGSALDLRLAGAEDSGSLHEDQPVGLRQEHGNAVETPELRETDGEQQVRERRGAEAVVTRMTC